MRKLAAWDSPHCSRHPVMLTWTVSSAHASPVIRDVMQKKAETRLSGFNSQCLARPVRAAATDGHASLIPIDASAEVAR
eukprot:4576047-Karenia_brevis.AAC.1